jgi:transcription antitermination factor NusG
MEYNWYVIYTLPRWEKKIAKILDERGIENYCPLNRVLKQWSDRKKIILEPLFKGYLFVKLEESKKWEIKHVEGVINFVHWLGKPAIVQDNEIDIIRKFLQEFENIEVADVQIKINTTVLIDQGVLMNYKGMVVEVLGNKARVKIESMGVQLLALIDKNKLKVIKYD